MFLDLNFIATLKHLLDSWICPFWYGQELLFIACDWSPKLLNLPSLVCL